MHEYVTGWFCCNVKKKIYARSCFCVICLLYNWLKTLYYSVYIRKLYQLLVSKIYMQCYIVTMKMNIINIFI